MKIIELKKLQGESFEKLTFSSIISRDINPLEYHTTSQCLIKELRKNHQTNRKFRS